MKGPGGSPWDVPGLGVDVGALLGDATGTKRAAAPRPGPPETNLPALVASSPPLAECVERCQDALGAARTSVRGALGADRARETPAVEAWLALMDEVLAFGQVMTGVLLSQSQSQSMRRNQ